MNFYLIPGHWYSNQPEVQAQACTETKDDIFKRYKDGVIEDKIGISATLNAHKILKLRIFDLNTALAIRMMNPEVYIYPKGKIWIQTSEDTNLPPELLKKYWRSSPINLLKTITEVEKAFAQKNEGYSPIAEQLLFGGVLTYGTIDRHLKWEKFFYCFSGKII